ncbi:hypothetical protein ACIQOU_05365 [Streptomyces sp. NPDC091279]|uniref:hypothetical protein n=1 Tax=unclassified Streptomyces TaxID=2593676 RepID=UPI003808682E
MRIEDPADGERSPYAALAPVGVTPWTTHDEMQDISFPLQEQGLMNSRTQQAWNDLRALRGRLLFDLFVYDVDDGPEPGPEPDPNRPSGPPPLWAARLLDDLIRFDR